MKRIIYFAFLILINHSYSQKNLIPENFTEFTESPSNGESFKRIETDFDNDKKADYITVIHNETYDDLRSNKKYLLIYLSSQRKNILIDFDFVYGVYFLSPKVKNKTLEFQLYQEGTGNRGYNLKLRYNNNIEKVQLIGLDYSYRVPGGHCNKSYNLLTGEYWVANDFYDIETKKTKIEKFYGTKIQQFKIYVSDFDEQLFNNLSEVGKEYERE